MMLEMLETSDVGSNGMLPYNGSQSFGKLRARPLGFFFPNVSRDDIRKNYQGLGGCVLLERKEILFCIVG